MPGSRGRVSLVTEKAVLRKLVVASLVWSAGWLIALMVLAYVSHARMANHGLFWGTALDRWLISGGDRTLSALAAAPLVLPLLVQRSWLTAVLAATSWIEFHSMQALVRALLD
jgi:hypothetical protein